jgi:hypothetical protein
MIQFSKLLAEMILTMQECLKYGGTDILVLGKGDNLEVFGAAVERVRRMVMEGVVVRDESSNRYNTKKFLEISHFHQADFKEYGVPSAGYSTETGELGFLNDRAKKPARRTQKGTDEIFSAQTCSRIQETALLVQRLQQMEKAESGRRKDGIKEEMGKDTRGGVSCTTKGLCSRW